MKEAKLSGVAARHRRIILAAAFIGGLLIAQTHFRLALVSGHSMLPGLDSGDLLLANKRAYRIEDPKRGDIVLARYDKELIVKRVVGLPGEEVALKGGHLYVNGSAVVEQHEIEPGSLDLSPGTLFQGKFALLGDNRSVSVSQIVPPLVSKEQIVGKVVWSLRLSKIVMAAGEGRNETWGVSGLICVRNLSKIRCLILPLRRLQDSSQL
jgi:signal peptidase I